jgi:hypothetical protein
MLKKGSALFRSAVVVIHAAVGICGLIAGLAAMAPPGPDDGLTWLRSLYATCLTVVLVTLVVLLAADWNNLDTGARGAFGALAGLAAVMVYRITRAYEVAGTRDDDWREQYIRHVYFTYIGLWEGFVIVLALRLPYPHLWVPLIVIAVLLVGGTLIDRYEARVLLARPAAPDTRAERDTDGHHPDRPRPRAP